MADTPNVIVKRERDLTQFSTVELDPDKLLFAADNTDLPVTTAIKYLTGTQLKDVVVRKTTLLITSAQLLACGTPILKMATPPTGYHYRLHRGSAKIDFKTTAYSVPGGLYEYLALRYVGQTKYSNYIIKLPLAFCEETETSYYASECGEGQIVNNAGMEVYCPEGNFTLGDSDIYWTIYYSIEPNL